WVLCWVGEENLQFSFIFQCNMADSEGFEPSRRFPAYTLSRRAPSTTRPTVRERLIPRLCGAVQGDIWGGRLKQLTDQASVIVTRRFWRPLFSILPISTRPISAVRRT